MSDIPKLPTEGSQYKRLPKRVTSDDLYKVAVDSGLQQEADNILSQKGEEAKEIFSGGIISDIFDGLNLLQYGVVGVLKGKSFADGVRTRQSFSDKDALGQFGLPGTILGIGLDIALDPLTYIAPFTRIAKFTKLSNRTQGIVGKALEKAPKLKQGVNWLSRKFVWMGGQDPIFKEAWERMTHGIGGDMFKFKRILEPMSKLDDGARRAIFNARTTGKWADISLDAKKAAIPVFSEIDKMSKELVDLGVLSPEKYNETVGTYLPRLLEVFEAPTKKNIGNLSNGRKISSSALARMKKRKDLPEEVLEALGEITEAGYPSAKALVNMSELVHKNRMYNAVLESGLAIPKTAEVIPEGLVQLQKSNRLGNLSEAFVPAPMAEYLNELVQPASSKVWKKIVGGFKFGKVVLNPATHGRNMISNMVLNGFEGLNPVEAPIKFWRSYSRASKAIAQKGSDEWYRAFREAGGAADSYMSQEILNLFRGPEALEMIGKTKGMTRKVWDQTAGRMAKLYQTEEEFAKMAQFIFQAEKLGAKSVNDLTKVIGKTALGDETIGSAAMKIAERATFNYAQVSPFVRKVRENVFGMPFITFTAKATPQVAKTALKAPGRVSWIGKVKNAIENMSDLEELKKERASEPPWVKDGLFVKLPMKDKHGRSAYFDLTYIIPFGDVVSGQLFERQIDRETGLPESYAEGLLKKAPVINLITEIGKNQDFYGNKIWRDGDSTDKQLADLSRHIMKSYLPPLIADQLPGGWVENGKNKGKRRPPLYARPQAAEGTQNRTAMQEFMRNLGLKVLPIDADIQSGFMEWEKKKALQTLLRERGALNTYQRDYLPKK